MSTLIGNMERLAFELVPVTPSWERRYSPESAAWAGLAIWIDGRNICSHVEPGSAEIKQHLFVPLGPVADWIVRSFPALAFEERAGDFPRGSTPHRDAMRWGLVPPPAGYSWDALPGEDARAWGSHSAIALRATAPRDPHAPVQALSSDNINQREVGPLQTVALAPSEAVALKDTRPWRRADRPPSRQPAHVLQIAHRSRQRLHRVHRKMRSRGKPGNVCVVAAARELSCFLWAAATAD